MYSLLNLVVGIYISGPFSDAGKENCLSVWISWTER